MADRNGSTMRRRSRRREDELAETTGLRIESAWRNSHGSRQEAQRRQAHRSHIPIPTNRNRHADRRTQSLYPCGETKHNQDPLTNRGMGDHTIAAPCTKAHPRVLRGRVLARTPRRNRCPEPNKLLTPCRVRSTWRMQLAPSRPIRPPSAYRHSNLLCQSVATTD